MEQKITQARLKELLSYDAESGLFHWKKRRTGVSTDGKIAGCKSVTESKYPSRSYWKIRVDKKLYYAHRLAWLWAHGELPDFEIDHKNGDGLDNRIENLRAVSSSQNKWNARMRRDNSSGFKGVVPAKSGKAFRAQIAYSGRVRYLGTFETAEEAARKYDEEALSQRGEYAVTNRSLGLL